MKAFTYARVLTWGALFGFWLAAWPTVLILLLDNRVIYRSLGLSDDLPGFTYIDLLTLIKSKVDLTYLSNFALPTALLFGIAAGAILFWLAWRLARLLRIDPEANALSSLLWTFKAMLSWNFALLLLLLYGLPWIWLNVLPLSVWWLALPLLAAITIALPQYHVVSLKSIGNWRTVNLPRWHTVVAFILLLMVSMAVAKIIRFLNLGEPLIFIYSILFWTVAICLALYRKSHYSEITKKLLYVFKWRQLSAWFLQNVWLGLLLTIPLVPILVASMFNIFEVPVILDALSRAGLAKPHGLVVWLKLSDYVVSYWSVITLPIFMSFMLLWSSRLLFQQTRDLVKEN